MTQNQIIKSNYLHISRNPVIGTAPEYKIQILINRIMVKTNLQRHGPNLRKLQKPVATLTYQILDHTQTCILEKYYEY